MIAHVGKTTVMIHRMFHRATTFRTQQQKIQNENYDPIDDHSTNAVSVSASLHLPQMLVTASPVLATAVRRNYGKLALSQMAIDAANVDGTTNTTGSSGRTSCFVAEVSYDTRLDAFPPEGYPLILTYVQFLGMVDRTLRSPFLHYSDHAGVSTGISYSSTAAASSPNNPTDHSESLRTLSTMVDFHRFRSHYYPMLGDVTDKRGIPRSPDELFKEFVCVIKGSIAAVKTSDGRLAESDYVELASKRDSPLDKEDRAHVYQLFEKYQKNRAQSAPGDPPVPLPSLLIHIHK